jgi:hypothetical protein
MNHDVSVTTPPVAVAALSAESKACKHAVFIIIAQTSNLLTGWGDTQPLAVTEWQAQHTCVMTFQPRLSPVFSGLSNSNWMDALAPPLPSLTEYVAAS